MGLTKAILLNLDTELDYYNSDGKTDFVGNRNTRTYIKDVSMGSGSTTSFGLMNLQQKDLIKVLTKQKQPKKKIGRFSSIFVNLQQEEDLLNLEDIPAFFSQKFADTRPACKKGAYASPPQEC